MKRLGVAFVVLAMAACSRPAPTTAGAQDSGAAHKAEAALLAFTQAVGSLRRILSANPSTTAVTTGLCSIDTT